jgi:hypothetical protein
MKICTSSGVPLKKSMYALVIQRKGLEGERRAMPSKEPPIIPRKAAITVSCSVTTAPNRSVGKDSKMMLRDSITI